MDRIHDDENVRVCRSIGCSRPTFDSEDYCPRCRQHGNARLCRVAGCDAQTFDSDDFCPKCRDEVAAARSMARSRFVIWGTAGTRKDLSTA
jgi:hypothetical protein